MKFDPGLFGAQRLSSDDDGYRGSRYADVRHALFSTAYYRVWGAPGERPLPIFAVTLGRVLRGAFSGGRGWNFLEAARRAVGSPTDLRWGDDGRGFRRLLHPNAVCLLGTWSIDASAASEYTGAFAPGARSLIVARYSTCCTNVGRGRTRSLSLVGKLYPTDDPNHASPLKTANFITQEDIGGAKSRYINDAVLSNSPNVTPWRRGRGFPILLATGVAFARADRMPLIRQLHKLAELSKPKGVPTRTPEYMQLTATENQPRNEEFDFRDEILSHIYDRGDPTPKRTLVFDVSVAESAPAKGRVVRRVTPGPLTRIGRIEFTEAVAGYNGDFVLHFQHPAWRDNVNDPTTVTGP